ncbi:hypothetical protein [Burkholderia reimsis]|nr:hypothetical protein [Burkholderia reimsis]
MSKEYVADRVVSGALVAILTSALMVSFIRYLNDQFYIVDEKDYIWLKLICFLILAMVFLAGPFFCAFISKRVTCFDSKDVCVAILCGRSIGVVLGLLIGVSVSGGF